MSQKFSYDDYMDTKRPTTFILGAGFSAAQQFPLMKGLKDRVIHFIEAEQHYRYADYIRPDNNFPKGKFYAGLEYIDPDNNLGFEELLIKLSAHKERCEPCTVTDQVLRMGTARLLWCITFFIGRFNFKDCYTRFAHGLKESEGEWKVVSFNWDILLEKSLSNIGCASWKYSLTPNDRSIPIIKPHGSINWNSFAQNANIKPVYPDYWNPIGVDSMLSYDAAEPLENSDLEDQNDDFRYCLYPGDPDLPESHEDLKRLWKDVHGAIQSAEKIVFIGYALPEYDGYAVSQFRELCKNKAVEVYDPSLTTLNRFHKIFPCAKLERRCFKDTPYAFFQPVRSA